MILKVFFFFNDFFECFPDSPSSPTEKRIFGGNAKFEWTGNSQITVYPLGFLFSSRFLLRAAWCCGVTAGQDGDVHWFDWWVVAGPWEPGTGKEIDCVHSVTGILRFVLEQGPKGLGQSWVAVIEFQIQGEFSLLQLLRRHLWVHDLHSVFRAGEVAPSVPPPPRFKVSASTSEVRNHCGSVWWYRRAPLLV